MESGGTMTSRLEAFLSPESVYIPKYPEDIKMLRDGIEDIRGLSDLQIETLYREYSEGNYCAEWLILDQNGVVEFNNWLNEEI